MGVCVQSFGYWEYINEMDHVRKQSGYEDLKHATEEPGMSSLRKKRLGYMTAVLKQTVCKIKKKNRKISFTNLTGWH